ncbi:hypothetical protein [Methylohalobius crimeensis]|uniref:hypothetical protein n=1 Tax=Methylohalobius crimeensis TaxID=244365 RepID=UPI0003B63E91|nr:hypothetical protein [Methylohalobius crimeensis]
MILLTASLAVFTVVALLGLTIALDLFRGYPVDRRVVLTHAGLAVFGAALAVGAALLGDKRVYVNIALVVVIVILGFLAASRRYKTGQVQKGLIVGHASMAVICYLILAAVVFGLNLMG